MSNTKVKNSDFGYMWNDVCFKLNICTKWF